jgi:hypothetical protein
VLKANRKIDKDAAASIRYRLKAKQPGAELQSLPETDSQKITRIDDQTVELVVSRLPHAGKVQKSKSPKVQTDGKSESQKSENSGTNDKRATSGRSTLSRI